MSDINMLGTYFYDQDGNRLASQPGIVSIPLTKGMKITIHDAEETYEVVDWSYHIGHPDEEAGLRVNLKLSTAKTGAPRRARSYDG